MKKLVVFYSLTGNNQKLANYLKENINCEIYEIKTKKKMGFSAFFTGLFFGKNPKIEENTIDLKSYDKIFFISPIWFGKLAFPLKAFLIKKKLNIQDYNFLSICLGGQKDKIENELFSILGKIPSYIEEFSFKKLIESGALKHSDKIDEKNFEDIKKDINKSLKYLS